MIELKTYPKYLQQKGNVEALKSTSQSRKKARYLESLGIVALVKVH